ncbi:phiSA1p31-related protein [Streptomyces sparsogenes]|uniref:phiSA1p31-related protein n=1 Tax=Streptomyces sparsogenes TaxID=67365 RepID=UPI0033EED2D3
MTFAIGDKVTHDGKSATIEGGPHTGYSEWYAVKGDDGKVYPVGADRLTVASGFAIGDEVETAAGYRAKVVAGPFVNRYGDGDDRFWVLEDEDGKHSAPHEYALTKVEPEPIKVGDRVRVVLATHAEKRHGSVGVVTNVSADWKPYDGPVHQYEVEFNDGDEIYAATVEKVTDDPNLHTYNGVTYDLSAEYRDKDGDIWRFARVGDEVRGEWGTYHITETSYTLEDVADRFGPLTRV